VLPSQQASASASSHGHLHNAISPTEHPIVLVAGIVHGIQALKEARRSGAMPKAMIRVDTTHAAGMGIRIKTGERNSNSH
jgi:hypothetical protein